MATTKWALDPTHSELGFKIKHLMISSVSGSFSAFDVKVETGNEQFTDAKVEVTVDVTSVSTNNEQRDQHLRNADFFETDKYPQLRFQSTRVEKVDSDTFNLYGNLTIREITKEVKLVVEQGGLIKDPWGNIKAGFIVSGKINRKDWGINYNAALETGGIMLGEEVKISAEVQLVKEAVEAAV